MSNASSKIRKAGRLLRAAMPVTLPRITVLITHAGPQPLNMAGGPP